MFLTLAGDESDVDAVRVLVDSLRTFGGELRHSPVWAFHPAGVQFPARDGDDGVRPIPLTIADPVAEFPFAWKVRAAALAAELLPSGAATAVWLDPAALVLRPPTRFALDGGALAAVRPVHIQNVGLRIDAPADPFWTVVYREVGAENDAPFSIESFVDRRTLRPYFNCAAFSVDPAAGILRQWWGHFERLVRDRAFLAGPCADEDHRTYLHQAVLSALVARRVPPDRLRLLPPDYGYPLHFDRPLRAQDRAVPADAITCLLAGYRDAFDGRLAGEATGRLREWLLEQARPAGQASV